MSCIVSIACTECKLNMLLLVFHRLSVFVEHNHEPYKMAELIEVLFWLQTRVGLWLEPDIRWGPVSSQGKG